MDDTLRYRLWNCFFPEISVSKIFPTFYKEFLLQFLEKPIDFTEAFSLKDQNYYCLFFDRTREYFLECPWHEVYDILELSVYVISGASRARLLGCYNKILAEEMSAYRFVSGQLIDIISEEEIASIERVGAKQHGLELVQQHIKQAVKHYANRKDPDYESSIKESIRAIEVLAQKIAAKDKTILASAFQTLHYTLSQPILEKELTKMYKCVCNNAGMEHETKTAEIRVDATEAQFILVLCSSFIHYLSERANQAGITLR